MPSVSLHYGPAHALDAAAFETFAARLADVIIDTLGAAPETVQIMPVPLAHTPLGTPVYVEIKARDADARTDAVLDAFVARVDALTFESFGARCRIRYFKYPGTFLAAAN